MRLCKTLLPLMLVTIFSFCTVAQEIPVPAHIPSYHPRLLTNDKDGKVALQTLLAKEAWANKNYQEIVKNLQPYLANVQKDSSWLLSRLQMYWKTHYTNVYVRNGVYVKGDGFAQVPTVRYTGTRDAVSAYNRPKVEDIKPFMDEDGKIYLQNKTMAGQPWEWVEQSKTGRVIEAINQQIIEIARDAAFVYWYTDDDQYGKLAYDVFNTYTTGMYYRNEPIDLNYGHDQTIIGMQSFEVIHEDIVLPLTICYNFLYKYIVQHQPAQQSIQTASLKHWADIIIKNGVPFNNWDLIEARFIANIAFILDDDNDYTDKKGCQYYLNHILNINSTRQLSLKDLMAIGFDANTGLWAECPGYSQNVVADFTSFFQLFYKTIQTDIQPQMPILNKAIAALPQYLFPNGYIVGSGDTHYGHLNTNSIEDMIRNAKQYHKKEAEIFYTKEWKLLQHFDKHKSEQGGAKGLTSLFGNGPLELNDTIKAAPITDFATPTFYAPNVSWFTQRSGYNNAFSGLMISEAGSNGNHQHAGGIAMELYGKGIVMAPEGGIGTSYFQTDYAEYYSQFPAHNTVCVEGISAYPVMRTHHPFELKSCYPSSNQTKGYFPLLTYSTIYFLEPETNADQQRLMGIIRTSDTTGFYVDIFRSKKKQGNDKYHDYIYHNIGQTVILTDNRNRELPLVATEQLTSAYGDQIGYDYWYDKKMIATNKDYKATFKTGFSNRDSLFMNMWMKGDNNREIYSVKAPPSKAYGRDEMLPTSFEELPLPTIVVRQKGEAWKHPFAAIYEPSSGKQLSGISSITSFEDDMHQPNFIGLKVETKLGATHTIYSSTDIVAIKYDNSEVKASYAVITESKKEIDYLFLGDGTKISKNGFAINSATTTNAVAVFNNNNISFASSTNATLSLPYDFKGKKVLLKGMIDGKEITIAGKVVISQQQSSLSFAMPAMQFTLFSLQTE